MLFHQVLSQTTSPSTKRESVAVQTERGRIKKIYIGRKRLIRNKITKKVIEQEAYQIATQNMSEVDYKLHWFVDNKIHWSKTYGGEQYER